MQDWRHVFDALTERGVAVLEDRSPTPVGGGDISQAWRLACTDASLFLKTGGSSALDMFEAEAAGLVEIRGTATVRVPDVIATGSAAGTAFIALEWLELSSADATAERRLGEQLAALHQHTAERYGWSRDNTIGRTPQINRESSNWLEFFGQWRLGYQLGLAAGNGFDGALQQQGREVLERLPQYFGDGEPSASLLHGDLWGGNWASCGGQPVLFDPAVYYGDPESDIAMTRLFGGFGEAFYEAYDALSPPRDGHQARVHLYQLYHVLNHLNLFGRAYHGRAVALMNALLQASRS